MEEGRIWIAVDEYAEFVREKAFLEMVMRAIYVGADISFDGEGLRLDAFKLAEFLKVADSVRFQTVYKTLKAEKDKEEETNE